MPARSLHHESDATPFIEDIHDDLRGQDRGYMERRRSCSDADDDCEESSSVWQLLATSIASASNDPLIEGAHRENCWSIVLRSSKMLHRSFSTLPWAPTSSSSIHVFGFVFEFPTISESARGRLVPESDAETFRIFKGVPKPSKGSYFWYIASSSWLGEERRSLWSGGSCKLQGNVSVRYSSLCGGLSGTTIAFANQIAFFGWRLVNLNFTSRPGNALATWGWAADGSKIGWEPSMLGICADCYWQREG